MNLTDALLETLHEFVVERSLPVPDDALRDLAQSLATSVECFNETSSYGRPSGVDMIAMHVRDATAPLKRQIADSDALHERELKAMTENRDYWRNQYYRRANKELA